MMQAVRAHRAMPTKSMKTFARCRFPADFASAQSVNRMHFTLPATSGISAYSLRHRGVVPRVGLKSPLTRAPRYAVAVRATETDGERENLSGEWPVNWSLASYEDVGEFFENNLFKTDAAPGNTLEGVMAKQIKWVTPDTRLDSLNSVFDRISGVPVVKSNADMTLVGVLSKKDLQRAGNSATVKDIMSTPPIAAKPTNKVADAACLMLKHKVHRIPVVDDNAKLVGMVTRTDIFTALAQEA